jgi:hypothetical protein
VEFYSASPSAKSDAAIAKDSLHTLATGDGPAEVCKRRRISPRALNTISWSEIQIC